MNTKLIFILAILGLALAQDPPANCAEADSADATKCKTCNAKFFAKEGVCTGCPANCDECSDETTCTKCASGTVLSEGNCLASCPEGKGATAEGNCVTCASNCTKCSEEGKCDECAAAFYINVSNKTCSACSANCGTCDLAGKCTACADGYKVKTDGTCKKWGFWNKWWNWLWVILLGLLLLALLWKICSLLSAPKVNYNNTSYVDPTLVQHNRVSKQHQSNETLLSQF